MFNPRSALSNPDPYVACHWNVTDHPHYHDCGNCSHAPHCDFGEVWLLQEYLNRSEDRINKMVADADAAKPKPKQPKPFKFPPRPGR